MNQGLKLRSVQKLKYTFENEGMAHPHATLLAGWIRLKLNEEDGNFLKRKRWEVWANQNGQCYSMSARSVPAQIEDVHKLHHLPITATLLDKYYPNCIRKTPQRSGDQAQSVEGLACKHEERGLDPHTHIKS